MTLAVDTLASTTLRHSGVVDVARLSIPINIIGTGSVGSFTALGLTKMGATNILLWDHDTVAIHNIGNQFFPLSSVGEKKVNVAQRVCEAFSGIAPRIISEQWRPADGHDLKGIVIMAPDRMTVRGEVWKACKENPNVELIIDARMGLEELIVLTVNPNLPSDQKIYENSWYPDEEAVAEKCTAKTIIYTVMFAAGEIIKRVKQYVTNSYYARHIVLSVPRLGLIEVVE